MIHGEGLTVKVCGEQRLWMAGRRQVDGHKVRVGIPRGIEIDRGFLSAPISLATSVDRRRCRSSRSHSGPPRDRAPAFNADQPRNLLTQREASQEIPNIERDAQARSEPIQGESTSNPENIAGIRSRSVVVILERGNRCRFGVGRHATSSPSTELLQRHRSIRSALFRKPLTSLESPCFDEYQFG